MMTLQFSRIPFAEFQPAYTQHLYRLPARVDSFMEAHVKDGNFYQISLNNATLGYASIHNEALITSFFLAPTHARFAQPAFWQLRRMEKVTSAFVPSCDEFFLTHALDEYSQLARQAYFFQLGNPALAEKARQGFRQTLAEPSDATLIETASGDFFDNIAERIARGELFLTWRDEQVVGFGIREMSAFYNEDGKRAASNGMFTLPAYRQQGVGSATIAGLIALCQAQGVTPVSGCWYYNHLSKRTLEHAGMIATTRLFKVAF
ncbi:MAG TPA: GNAT family N-acetyltransferase [Anaerolineales bacterium]|nr:GNAT family N-acetyltransferase [Anaerolineales bacterium]